MFAVLANVVAFFLGAKILALTNQSFLGVIVFTAVALVGTLAATLLDVCVRSLLPSAGSPRMPRDVGLAAKPLPASSGHTR